MFTKVQNKIFKSNFVDEQNGKYGINFNDEKRKLSIWMEGSWNFW